MGRVKGVRLSLQQIQRSRKYGRMGGKARAKALTAKQRRESALKASKAAAKARTQAAKARKQKASSR
jgi:hypothetical protein